MDDLPTEWLAAASRRTAAVLPRALLASRFLARTLQRHCDWTLQMLRNGGFERPATTGTGQRLHDAVAGADERGAFQRELRRFRNREMARIALRDIAGWSPLDETLQALSDLADAACDAALAFACTALQSRYGTPHDETGAPATPIVLGMGKLGGRELNFSSDIDLIFAYSAAGQTDGAKSLDNEEYFGRLARETTRLLSAVTEDGFVFRVDTLLRPFGSVGAAALSSAAMEAYYQAHGREWERYALIKARPVAGDRAAGAALLETLQPFVYRHYLDYNALGALREMKSHIDAAARKRGCENDLKLGPGGIRELEFIVQLFQLVRGGQDARLRDTGLRRVLAQLGALELLPQERVRALDQAYVFLRRSENAVQLYEDAQTHAVPAAAQARSALCAALEIESWETFRMQLEQVRHCVRENFEGLFEEGSKRQAVERSSEGSVELWKFDAGELTVFLCERGYREDTERLAGALLQLRGSRMVRALGETALTRLRVAVNLLVVDAASQPDPETALLRALQVVTAIGGRSTYLTLLGESAVARTQLLRLVAASPWITHLLAQTPALLDTLLDPRLADEAPNRDELHAELARRAGGVDAADTEASMALLRGYRQEMMLRIAAADLAGALPLVQVSDRLTWLAQAILDKAVGDAHRQLAEQYGQALNADGQPAPFVIIGYGKFGSIELGYGSDLDLVFIYEVDDVNVETVGGRRALSAGEYFVRLGQRVVQLLSAMTGAGRAYEIDLQLRPSGGSGLVVSSLQSWTRYEHEQAWTWEHQALLRARPVSGDARLGEAVNAVRREVLTRPRDARKLLQEVREMRQKMRASLEQRVAGRWDVKQGVGGLVDTEFLVQFLLLRSAAKHPELITYTDNWRQIEALTAVGVFLEVEASALVQAGRTYRNWMHRRALQEAEALADEAQFTDERAQIRRLWSQHMEVAT